MPDEVKETSSGRSTGKRRPAMVVLIAVLLLAAVGGLWLWYRSQIAVTTDNAFIEGHVFSISSRVPGHVLEVPVEDNQRIPPGELLVQLDPAPYEAEVAAAEARLAAARNETSGEYAQVAAARASVEQAQAELEQADIDLRRGRALLAEETIPRAQFDRLETVRRVAAGRLSQAKEGLRRAEAVIGSRSPQGQEARVALRAAELERARLSLAYTRIVAPAEGFITRKSVEVGTNVQPGQPLMALVQLRDTWIVANYKESQLFHVRPGQEVAFEVDAYPGRDFTGKVDSIMAGTGAAFSLLPPENATGNYVKVVQRVPVKITVDQESDPEHLLRVGMSVVPTIHTGRTLGDVLQGLFD